jgi:hypothetical protein
MKCLCGHSFKRHLFQGWIPCKDCICGMFTLDEPDLPKWVRDTWEDKKLKTHLDDGMDAMYGGYEGD